MSDEQIPDPLAMMDQLLRGLADMARVLHSYNSALIDAGFDREEALALTVAFQAGIQAGSVSE